MGRFDLQRLTDLSHKTWGDWRRADRGAEVLVSVYTSATFWCSLAVAKASGLKK